MSGRWIEPGEPFGRVVTGFKRTAWRYECQGTYREPVEVEPWRQWRAGVRDTTWMDSWVEAVQRIRQRGRTFQRVRMLTDPPTDYLRWMLDVTPTNIAAGEDIRWITESAAQELGMPGYDFYLFDDEQVAIMHFGDHGVSGAELIDDPTIVSQHIAWRDRVWPVAITHDQYLSRQVTRGVREHTRSPQAGTGSPTP